MPQRFRTYKRRRERKDEQGSAPALKELPVSGEEEPSKWTLPSSGDKLYTMVGTGFREGGGYLAHREGDRAINQVTGQQDFPEEASLEKSGSSGWSPAGLGGTGIQRGAL